MSDNRKQTIQDEKDATVREGARQAQLEKDRVQRAADDAVQFAAEEVTAAKAKTTFWERFKRYIGSDDQQ